MKKPYSAKVDESILEGFKKKCRENDLFVSEAIEAMMYAYINDDINISIKTVYDVKNTKGE